MYVEPPVVEHVPLLRHGFGEQALPVCMEHVGAVPLHVPFVPQVRVGVPLSVYVGLHAYIAVDPYVVAGAVIVPFAIVPSEPQSRIVPQVAPVYPVPSHAHVYELPEPGVQTPPFWQGVLAQGSVPPTQVGVPPVHVPFG